jgi:hypothetical protein
MHAARKIEDMDFTPPPAPSAAIPRDDERPEHGPESVQPHVVLNSSPVSGYSYDSSGNVQGGVIRHSVRVDWE